MDNLLCPRCNSNNIIKNGSKKGKPAYRCKDCNKQTCYPVNGSIMDDIKTQDQISAEFSKNTAIITTRSLNIKTLSDALKASKTDMNVWEVDHHIINFWEVTMGAKSTGTEKPKTFTNYQVKVWLKRKIIKPVEIALQYIVSKINKGVFEKNHKYPVLNTKEKCLQEVCLYDSHFGLLAWRYETGEDYDIKIAKQTYLNGISDLLARGKGFNVDRILLPIGQDFFHVNNPEAITPRNRNVLDTDCRLAKVFEYGIETVITAVKMCLENAPVDLIWVPGNHDPETSYFLCKVIEAKYWNNKHVKINVNPDSRKYYRYGTTLLGFTHGCDISKYVDLPTIMATERPNDWAESRNREWHIGHLHKKKETKYIAGDTFNGVSVKVIPSLTGTDAWHYKKGYVKNVKAAETYLYSYLNGYIGHFSTNIFTR